MCWHNWYTSSLIVPNLVSTYNSQKRDLLGVQAFIRSCCKCRPNLSQSWDNVLVVPTLTHKVAIVVPTLTHKVAKFKGAHIPYKGKQMSLSAPLNETLTYNYVQFYTMYLTSLILSLCCSVHVHVSAYLLLFLLLLFLHVVCLRAWWYHILKESSWRKMTTPKMRKLMPRCRALSNNICIIHGLQHMSVHCIIPMH